MKKAYDIVITQEYQSKGETKKKYINIGACFEGEKGMSIKIESIPLGWNGWAGLYVPKPKENNDSTPAKSKDELSDDIPW